MQPTLSCDLSARPSHRPVSGVLAALLCALTAVVALVGVTGPASAARSTARHAPAAHAASAKVAATTGSQSRRDRTGRDHHAHAVLRHDQARRHAPAQHPLPLGHVGGGFARGIDPTVLVAAPRAPGTLLDRTALAPSGRAPPLSYGS